MTNDRVQPRTDSTERHHAGDAASTRPHVSLTDPHSNDMIKAMRSGGSASGGRLNPSEWHNYGKSDTPTGTVNVEPLEKTRTFEPHDGKTVDATGVPVTHIETSVQHAPFAQQAKDTSQQDDSRGVTRTPNDSPAIIMEGPPHRDPVRTGDKGQAIEQDKSKVPGKEPGKDSLPPGSQPIVHENFGPTQEMRDAAKDKVKQSSPENGLTDAQNQMVSNIQNAVLQGNLAGLQTAIKEAAGDPAKLKEVLDAAQNNLQVAGSDISLALSGNNVFMYDGTSNNALEINPADGTTTVRPLSRENGKVTAMPGEVLSRDAESVLNGMAFKAIVDIQPDKSRQADKAQSKDVQLPQKTQQRPVYFPPVYEQSSFSQGDFSEAYRLTY